MRTQPKNTQILIAKIPNIKADQPPPIYLLFPLNGLYAKPPLKNHLHDHRLIKNSLLPLPPQNNRIITTTHRPLLLSHQVRLQNNPKKYIGHICQLLLPEWPLQQSLPSQTQKHQQLSIRQPCLQNKSTFQHSPHQRYLDSIPPKISQMQILGIVYHYFQYLPHANHHSGTSSWRIQQQKCQHFKVVYDED